MGRTIDRPRTITYATGTYLSCLSVERGKGVKVVFDICANILKPVDDGQYVVLVSAYPAEPEGTLATYPHLSCPVQTLEQARKRRFALIDQMKIDLEQNGHSIREVQLKG